MNAKETRGASSWNLPNALTTLRIILVPVFLWLLLDGGVAQRWAALGVFVVAAFTDHLDGRIARSRGLITNFGKLADPLADKVMTLGAFVAFSVLGELPWWFTILMAVREVGVTILREVLRRRGTVVAASSGGKLKTVLQILAITLMTVPWVSFLPSSAVHPVQWATMLVAALALAVTLVTGLQYAVSAWRANR